MAQAGQTHDLPDVEIPAMFTAGPAVAAWDGENLVGMMRALSDGCLVAYLEEAVIHPAYRDQGLPGRLLAMLLAELQDVTAINLCCGPGPMPHYQQHGFTQTGLALLQRHQARQTT
jgi:ribosomal protein S18 acetylase RimI-like enzyme